jgi:ubiquinone/menaquinone biosynthesis C-methylase UbiE
VTSADIRGAYDQSAEAWTTGPEPVYARLAEVLVAASPLPLAGARVLDLGAGTGVAGRAARDAGAEQVVGVDVALNMLRLGRTVFDPVLADAAALPFGAASFDVVVAACCLGHLPDPVAALRETRRVAAAIVASAFAADWTHPAKAAVDDVLLALGFRPPPWYEAFKVDTERRVEDPVELAALAKAAGYRTAEVRTVQVATGINSPAGQVAWRMGMAHIAPFVRSLAPQVRAQARRAAEDALVGAPPLVMPLVVLSAP